MNLGGGPHNGCTLSNCTRVKDSPARPWNPDYLSPNNPAPNGGIDCMDNESTVNPGAPYHTDGPGAKNWDYDCSGVVEGGWETADQVTAADVYHVLYKENKSTNHLANPWDVNMAGCGNYSGGIEPPLCDLKTINATCPVPDFNPTDGPGTSVENGFVGVLENCTVVKCLGTRIQSYCK
jgi:hypothetical protein